MLQCHIRVIECCDAHVRSASSRRRNFGRCQPGLRRNPQPGSARFRRQASPQVRVPPPGAARGARRAAKRVRPRCEAGFPRRNEEDSRQRMGRRAAAEGPAGPSRRDYRPDRPQDGDQRAQLRRGHLHGGLRGRELSDLAQHGRWADQSARCSASHDQPGAERQEVPPQRQDRGAHPAPARLAPRREARDDRRQAGVRRRLRLRAVLLSQRRTSWALPRAASRRRP
jgi:hypothetical protein